MSRLSHIQIQIQIQSKRGSQGETISQLIPPHTVMRFLEGGLKPKLRRGCGPVGVGCRRRFICQKRDSLPSLAHFDARMGQLGGRCQTGFAGSAGNSGASQAGSRASGGIRRDRRRGLLACGRRLGWLHGHLHLRNFNRPTSFRRHARFGPRKLDSQQHALALAPFPQFLA
jgi:hypothetical protein